MRLKVGPVLATLALAGCIVPAPPRQSAVVQDVDFVRGCWVEKQEPDGPATGFLRLLPDGTDYAGTLTRRIDGEIQTVGRLAFARDGSRLTIQPDSGDATALEARDPALWPAEPNKAVFVSHTSPDIEPVSVGGDANRLAIGFGGGLLGLVLFERDGCD